MRECTFWKIKQWQTRTLEKQREELCLYSQNDRKRRALLAHVSLIMGNQTSAGLKKQMNCLGKTCQST